jgi:hypothetical protein
LLFDAGKYNVSGTGYCPFNLIKRFDGRLYFVASDSNCAQAADGSKILYTGYSNPTSTTNPPAHIIFTGWHHILATWSLDTTASLKVYVDGVLDSSETTQPSTGAWPSGTKAFDTLYIGDNRTSGVTPWNTFIGSFINMPGTTDSAAGLIDEVHIYSGALSGATTLNTASASGTDVYTDYHMTRATCGSTPDHYELSVPSSSVACVASTVTVTACADNSSPCTNPSTTVSGTAATLAASSGTLGSTTVTFNASGVASTTLSYPTAADGSPATVTLSGEQTAAANPRKCCTNGTSCSVANSCSTTFNTSGFIFSDTTLGNAYTIPTQVAGTSSGTYYLRAVKTPSSPSTQACESALSGANTVNFGYECNNPLTCSSSNLMSINGGTSTSISRNNNGSHASTTSVNMTFDANGNAPFTLNYSDVGFVTLWATKAAGGSLLTSLAGSSNSFLVKPDHFDISNIKRTSDGVAAPSPAPTDATGTAFIKAGSPFTATVKAMTSGGVVTPNYGKETAAQGVRLMPTLIQPAGIHNPALTNPVITGAEFGATGQVASDVNGVATVANLAWDEAGIITLNAVPDNGGSANYLGDSVLGTTTGMTGNIGRFYPDHFALSSNSITNRADIAGCTDTFTYFGEQLKGIFTLTAQSSSGATTENYLGTFAKLDPSVFSNLQMGAVDRTTVLTPGPPYLLTPSNAGMPAISCTTAPCFPSSGTVGTGVLGIAKTVTVPFMFSRTSAQGPYNVLDVGINPIDSDGVTVPFNIDTATATNPAATMNKGKIGTATLRYGRMSIPNGYGSELLNLPINLTAQYWNGSSSYLTNTLDNCTSLANTNFSQTPGTGGTINTTITGGGTISAGTGTITLSKPTGFTTKGSVNINSGIGYLPGTGLETFGVYKAGPVIYMREIH